MWHFSLRNGVILLVTTLSTTCLAASSPPHPLKEINVGMAMMESLEPTRTLQPRAPGPDVSIPPVDIPEVSLPPLSLDLPTPTCTPTIAPGKDGYLPPGSCGALWNYFPSFAAAVAFAILFGVLLVVHLGQAIVHHTGYAWVVIMASIWECASYVGRAGGSKDQQSEALATLSQILVLVAPLWVNAFAYMVFARVVHFYSPTRRVWVFSPSILAFIFVSLDVVAFVIQLIGGGMAGPGSSPEAQRRGINIYMGGIGMQEGFIVIFVGLILKFHREQLRAERTGMLIHAKARWRPLVYALYGCLLAITVRIIFRLVEFSGGEGTDNPLPQTESYFYALDAGPMWLALVVWNAIHPGRYMQGPDAKLPPSWLSRHLCCCCHRKGRDKLGSHQSLKQPLDDSNELYALRSTHYEQNSGTVYRSETPPIRRDQGYIHNHSPGAADLEPSAYIGRQPRDFLAA